MCRGWESGVERHPSRVILLPRVSCLAGVCIYRASTHSISQTILTSILPEAQPSWPYWDGQSSDGISQNLRQSAKPSSGSPGGDSQGPSHTGAGTRDRPHVPMCRVHRGLPALGPPNVLLVSSALHTLKVASTASPRLDISAL